MEEQGIGVAHRLCFSVQLSHRRRIKATVKKSSKLLKLDSMDSTPSTPTVLADPTYRVLDSPSVDSLIFK
ncbi:hypothetical protein BT69DRAFT_1291522, partial [Atractiella rhizophila]